MRLIHASALLAAILLATSPASATEPDGGLAFIAGTAAFVATFTVGGLVIATANDGAAQGNAGWLTMESGFVLAPIVSHAVVDEWTRGLLFAAPPAAAVAGTATLFQLEPETIVHGSLPQQRVLWSFFVAGLLSGAAGVVDSTLAAGRRRGRSVAIIPSLGRGEIGVQVGGTL